VSSGYTTGPPQPALLLIDDHDFGVIAPSAADGVVLMLSNAGDVGATDIAASALMPPFAFDGGAYPGSGGTCGAMLGAAKTCSLALTFTPFAMGQWTSELVLGYAGGDETEVRSALVGASAGTTVNLLDNGDAEAGGDPPTGWTPVFGAMATRDGAAAAHGGTRSIYGGPFVEVGTAQLQQRVELPGYEPVIDAGQLGYAFAGFARSFGVSDDPYQIRLAFLQGDGAEIAASDLGAQNQVGAYQALADARQLPVGTRTIAVDLFCHKLNGDNCSAFFDDLSLTLTYVAP
jgi:hypothetical protein